MAAGLTDKPPTEAPARGAFLRLVLGGYTVQNPVPLATQWLHGPETKKPSL